MAFFDVGSLWRQNFYSYYCFALRSVSQQIRHEYERHNEIGCSRDCISLLPSPEDLDFILDTFSDHQAKVTSTCKKEQEHWRRFFWNKLNLVYNQLHFVKGRHYSKEELLAARVPPVSCG